MLAGWRKLFADRFEHQRVDLRHAFGDPVVALHELLAGAFVRVAAEAELLCHLALKIEKESIFGAVGQQMQMDADVGQKTDSTFQSDPFVALNQTVLLQDVPDFSFAFEAGCACYPAQTVQIAQPAGALLDVRFQAERRVRVAQVSLFLFGQFRRNELFMIHAGIDGLL